MESFTARFDIAALDSATLVKYGCQYAYTQEYSIDDSAGSPCIPESRICRPVRMPLRWGKCVTS
ncbi:MAG: hypothetical protein ACLURV_09980 [Gallintestinimicrobium sp.]